MEDIKTLEQIERVKRVACGCTEDECPRRKEVDVLVDLLIGYRRAKGRK